MLIVNLTPIFSSSKSVICFGVLNMVAKNLPKKCQICKLLHKHNYRLAVCTAHSGSAMQ